MSGDALDAELMARSFHEAYERLAPSFGYRTREASAVPWVDVPDVNKDLMVAVAAVVAATVSAHIAAALDAEMAGWEPDTPSVRLAVNSIRAALLGTEEGDHGMG